jgi:hypothetical protein
VRTCSLHAPKSSVSNRYHSGRADIKKAGWKRTVMTDRLATQGMMYPSSRSSPRLPSSSCTGYLTSNEVLECICAVHREELGGEQ